jgi:hypothetical protein
MKDPSELTVPVDFSANIFHRGRDGSTSTIAYEKEFMLPVGDIERGKTDRTYRANGIGDMLRRSESEIMSLKPSWPSFSCQGNLHNFHVIPSGLTVTDENDRVPCSMFLIPVCSDGRCTTLSTQEFHSMLAAAAKATGTERTLHPDRAIQTCRQCRKSDDASERFQQCSRCKVTYYCSRDCQKDHWSIHKKECLPAPL